MKPVAGLLLLLVILVLSASAAGAQVQVPGISGGGSCYQVPATEPTASAPAMRLGTLGWDFFLSSHASQLLLSISRWHPAGSQPVVVARVRAPQTGARVAR
jgi:hypothetical protein